MLGMVAKATTGLWEEKGGSKPGRRSYSACLLTDGARISRSVSAYDMTMV